MSDWGGERLQDDIRWKYGVPPVSNANYAWLQHMVHHMNPTCGVAATVLANGSLSTNMSTEGEIRKNLINADIVDCIVAMPGQLFYTTGIPVALWILRKGKTENTKGKILFINAKDLGTMLDRRIRELDENDIKKIADTYHAWRKGEGYEDVLGFCKEVEISEIGKQEYILTPGRYVGIDNSDDDSEPFDEKMDRLVSELSGLYSKAIDLQNKTRKELSELGFNLD